MLWFEWKQRIRGVRLTRKNGVCSLSPADILQNAATHLTYNWIPKAAFYLFLKIMNHKTAIIANEPTRQKI